MVLLPEHALIVVESIFSMEGDHAPLADLVALAERYGAELIVDEAHAIGVRGPRGSGCVAEAGLSARVLATVHTCGKALAAAGAFVCGSDNLRRLLINRARTFIFNTALPPYFASQVSAGMHLAADAELERARLMELSTCLRDELRANGFDTGGSDSQIVPVILGANEVAVSLCRAPRNEGLRHSCNSSAHGSGRIRAPSFVADGQAFQGNSCRSFSGHDSSTQRNPTLSRRFRHPMTGYFVTGTDTNVGKTVLSALLVAALDAAYWKPVQTGAREGTDRESVRAWAEATEDQLPLERYWFDSPVSPHLAAREAGIRIALEAFEFPEAPEGRKWIVEGAGGVMVPLNERDLMRDLMKRIGFPVIVAARTSLGTINHTLLTLAALREARLPICGVVLIGDEEH